MNLYKVRIRDSGAVYYYVCAYTWDEAAKAITKHHPNHPDTDKPYQVELIELLATDSGSSDDIYIPIESDW